MTTRVTIINADAQNPSSIRVNVFDRSANAEGVCSCEPAYSKVLAPGAGEDIFVHSGRSLEVVEEPAAADTTEATTQPDLPSQR